MFDVTCCKLQIIDLCDIHVTLAFLQPRKVSKTLWKPSVYVTGIDSEHQEKNILSSLEKIIFSGSEDCKSCYGIWN